MHIEPGYLSATKVLAANLAAVGVLTPWLPPLFKQPLLIPRTLLAALFFSLFMQSFHLPVGASELHFVGAMPIYILFGLIPTLLGFALGLLLQGLLFEPQDLVHLSVNTLSLVLPLIAVHYGLGRRITQITIPAILKLDGAYYTGVTLMVGFWLLIGNEAVALSNWALFAASYIVLVMIEPLFTFGLVKVLQPHLDRPVLRHLIQLPTRA